MLTNLHNFLLLERGRNLQQNMYKNFHDTLYVLLHYLVKCTVISYKAKWHGFLGHPVIDRLDYQLFYKAYVYNIMCYLLQLNGYWQQVNVY